MSLDLLFIPFVRNFCFASGVWPSVQTFNLTVKPSYGKQEQFDYVNNLSSSQMDVHAVGGDVSLWQNMSAWLESIDANPAIVETKLAVCLLFYLILILSSSFLPFCFFLCFLFASWSLMIDHPGGTSCRK